MKFVCVICAIERDETDLHEGYINICKHCIKDQNNRKALIRQHNDGWMEIAKDNQIDLWDRQPVETDTEWKIWQAYSGMYPDKKPNYRDVAEIAGCSLSYAQKTGSRWDFNIRMQHYKRHVDELTKQERAVAIKEMNAKHISMAEKLRAKLDSAIDAIDPYALKPSDLNSLMRTMSELERKAHVSESSGDADVAAMVDTSQGGKEIVTKKEDMSEILQILGAAGMLEGKTVGIEKTERVIIKED